MFMFYNIYSPPFYTSPLLIRKSSPPHDEGAKKIAATRIAPLAATPSHVTVTLFSRGGIYLSALASSFSLGLTAITTPFVLIRKVQ